MNCLRTARGSTVLIALGILKHLAIDRYPVDSPDSLHLQIEAMKWAFDAAQRHIADPAWMTVEPSSLLDEAVPERDAPTRSGWTELLCPPQRSRMTAEPSI